MRNRSIGKEYFDHLVVALVLSTASCLFLVSKIGVARSFEILIASAWVFGTFFFLITLFRQAIRIPWFLLNLLVQTILAAIAVLSGASLLSWLFIAIFNSRSLFDPEVLKAFGETMTPQVLILISGVGVVISGMVNILLEIDRKMGPGVIWNWITGKYYAPREEERIFVFLDMKDSTLLAEKLGNLKFGALVRDFFRDLTGPLIATKGEVSHYIGDEAVLTWRPEQGLPEARCLFIFDLMQKAIHARGGHYEKQYGLIPEFKAGAHIGLVVATEVGDVKSEVVFHGDVLNTAARIQGLCNESRSPFLISSALAERLYSTPGVTLQSLGMRSLKGKESELEIFAVQFDRATAGLTKNRPSSEQA